MSDDGMGECATCESLIDETRAQEIREDAEEMDGIHKKEIGTLTKQLADMQQGICDAVNQAEWQDTVWMPGPVHNTFVEQLAEVADLVITDNGELIRSTHGATQLKLKGGAGDG